jgi:hypothetical protein
VADLFNRFAGIPKPFMKKYLILILAVAAVSLAACRKEGTNDCIAGTGGTITLGFSPEHHGDPIYGATVYIEFNTQSFPGSLSNFDYVVTGEANEDHIHVDNMKCGNYYVYCVGYDSAFAEVVRGGMSIRVGEHADNHSNFTVPVTE